MMKRKRVLWTPDEHLEAAFAAFESAFGGTQPNKPVAPAQKPALLPRPIWTPPVQREGGITLAQIRKAQRAERKRARFNKEVKTRLAQAGRKLTATQKEQIRAAKAAYRAAVRQQRARAQAALKTAVKAKAAAENLRAQVQAARNWLRLEALRRRNLDQQMQRRISLRKEWGFGVLLAGSTPKGVWGESCRLDGPFAKAAALVWAAEQK